MDGLLFLVDPTKIGHPILQNSSTNPGWSTTIGIDSPFLASCTIGFKWFADGNVKKNVWFFLTLNTYKKVKYQK